MVGAENIQGSVVEGAEQFRFAQGFLVLISKFHLHGAFFTWFKLIAECKKFNINNFVGEGNACGGLFLRQLPVVAQKGLTGVASISSRFYGVGEGDK